ncbi:Uncharacterized protein BM_BM9503 [Brugia malayi]|uniref:Bm9503 n=1 Tax=Brugia malayi TaxID=6279 RepID=A0A1U7F4B7_BRUMA|nr:Uncharacterized protein BM_BM9503 [Brugia malayi]CTP81150.1 Bm9503 [Brugia malayi]VIO88675.1 Uncharacterized protein BM_BM9503 [Brugia malayi]
MSSSRLPSDCTIQGPSWDEFDRSEELDYNSGSDHETDEQGCRSRNFDLVAPPGFCATARQIQMHVDEVRLAQSNYLDQLPNSVNELGTTASSDQQRYGPSLPPGFTNSSEEDDPEDPGDPEDPDEGDSQSAMPNMCSFLQFSMPNNIPSSSSQSSSFDPTVPNSSEIFAPSLPEEETKRSRESFLLPPPEPGEAHSSSAGYSLKRMIGPSMPDLLPTVANLGNDDEEDSRDVYGPAIPYDLQNKPSTSGGKDLDVEVPIDDETCGHDNGDTSGVFGPVPPWEQKGNGDDEYAERLVRLEMLQTSKRSACKRPEWMMQPPKCFSSYGLSSKTFSLREDFATAEKAKRDWTETPVERKRRLITEQGDPSGAGPSGLSFEAHRNRNVNAIQTQIAAALGKDRVESLVDVYQRKRKHETDENGTVVATRRPFDRNKDLDNHTFGRTENLSADAIKERCGQLNSRFASSSSQKFL